MQALPAVDLRGMDVSVPIRDSSGGAATTLSRARVGLLGQFSLHVDDRPVELSRDSQRLVAFLALRRRRVPRALAAGTLWIDNTQERAFGNLRSALWRLRQHTCDLVDSDSASLQISAAVEVDVADATAIAGRLGDARATTDAPGTDDLSLEPFLDELLPGWYDDWAIVERERVRQLSLHALESISGHQLALGRFDSAIQAAWCAVRLDPLRESAHRRLIEIHLAEGNRSEALRQFRRYEELLASELGIGPSPLIVQLIS